MLKSNILVNKTLEINLKYLTSAKFLHCILYETVLIVKPFMEMVLSHLVKFCSQNIHRL